MVLVVSDVEKKAPKKLPPGKTFRLDDEDRDLLERMVASRQKETVDDGVIITESSFLRGLIRKAAREMGLTVAPSPSSEATLTYVGNGASRTGENRK